MLVFELRALRVELRFGVMEYWLYFDGYFDVALGVDPEVDFSEGSGSKSFLDDEILSHSVFLGLILHVLLCIALKTHSSAYRRHSRAIEIHFGVALARRD